MFQFACDEIIIPDGPYKDLPFDPALQPFNRLWFEAIDSGRWRRHAATGPTQSGKSLVCWVIPALYHLFEHNETVICGVPTMEMAQDKWREDLLPAIQASPNLRQFLPQSGEGSRGGNVKSAIRFENGATLRFMTGGGGDEERSAFTSRVVVITEADKMDETGANSREADKITQIEARTDAYGDEARIYLECTVSFEKGRIWREYQEGTCSEIVRPCHACGEWVKPDREELVGWREAKNEVQAKRQSSWSCPECNALWNDTQRSTANNQATLIHRGQLIDKTGNVEGDFPDTETLSVRWTATDNQFWHAGTVGAREWKASRDPDEENAEKQMRQFVWALPYVPADQDITALDANAITNRAVKVPKGQAPSGTDLVTVGIDVGKWVIHWVALAWTGPTPHLIEWNTLNVPTKEFGVERAIAKALGQFRDLMPSWGTVDGRRIAPKHVWIDSGYKTSTIYDFCFKSGYPFMSIKGIGESQAIRRKYSRPNKTGGATIKIGAGWHLVKMASPSLRRADLDADYWKSYVAERLKTPIGMPGAMTLYDGNGSEHMTFARHITAERQIEEFDPKRGLVVKWKKDRQQNHLLDATYIACAAADYAGVRLVETPNETNQSPTTKPSRKSKRWATEGGRKF